LLTKKLDATLNAGAKTWSVTLPPLEKIYFGVLTISLNYEYHDNKPSILASISKTPVTLTIALLGLQLGVSKDDFIRNNSDEELITNFAYLEDDTDESKKKFETRRLVKFDTNESNRKILTQKKDKTWAEKKREAPQMPALTLETQIIGLTSTAISLIYQHLVEKDKIASPINKVTRSKIQKYFQVKTKWTANFISQDSSKTSENITLKGDNECFLYNPPGPQSSSTPPAGFVVGFKQFKPIPPPEIEAKFPYTGFRDIEWMRYPTPVHAQTQWPFEYEGTTIGWHPAIGKWVDSKGKSITATAKSTTNPKHYYLQNLFEGDLEASANITLFQKDYTLYIPSSFIKVTSLSIDTFTETEYNGFSAESTLVGNDPDLSGGSYCMRAADRYLSELLTNKTVFFHPNGGRSQVKKYISAVQQGAYIKDQGLVGDETFSFIHFYFTPRKRFTQNTIVSGGSNTIWSNNRYTLVSIPEGNRLLNWFKDGIRNKPGYHVYYMAVSDGFHTLTLVINNTDLRKPTYAVHDQGGENDGSQGDLKDIETGIQRQVSWTWGSFWKSKKDDPITKIAIPNFVHFTHSDVRLWKIQRLK